MKQICKNYTPFNLNYTSGEVHNYTHTDLKDFHKDAILLDQEWEYDPYFKVGSCNNDYFYYGFSQVKDSLFVRNIEKNYLFNKLDAPIEILNFLFPPLEEAEQLISKSLGYLVEGLDFFYQSDYIFQKISEIKEIVNRYNLRLKCNILKINSMYKGEEYDHCLHKNIDINYCDIKSYANSNDVLFFSFNFYDDQTKQVFLKKFFVICAEKEKIQKYTKSKKYVNLIQKAIIIKEEEKDFIEPEYTNPEQKHPKIFTDKKYYKMPSNPSNYVLSCLQNKARLFKKDKKMLEKVSKETNITRMIATLNGEINKLENDNYTHVNIISTSTNMIKKTHVYIKELEDRLVAYKSNIIEQEKRISNSNSIIAQIDIDKKEKQKNLLEYQNLLSKIQEEIKEENQKILEEIKLQPSENLKESYITGNVRITGIFINHIQCTDENIISLLSLADSKITNITFNTLKNSHLNLITEKYDTNIQKESIGGPYSVSVVNENGWVNVYVGLLDSSSVIYVNPNNTAFVAPHPHTNWGSISNIYIPHFKACLGEAEPYLRDAFKAKNIAQIINIVLSWLGNNRTRDTWSDEKRNLRLFINDNNKHLLEKEIVINDQNIDLLYIKILEKNNDTKVFIEKNKKYYCIINESQLTFFDSIKNTKKAIAQCLSEGYQEKPTVSVHSVFYNPKLHSKTLEYYNELLEKLLLQKGSL